MRRLFSALMFALIPTLAVAATTLVWEQPTTNTDGTPLTDLAGNKVYCGYSQGHHTIIVDVGLKAPAGQEVRQPSSEIVTVDGKYYCAVTAYDDSGNESGKSNEVLLPLDSTAPGVPQKIIIIKVP